MQEKWCRMIKKWEKKMREREKGRFNTEGKLNKRMLYDTAILNSYSIMSYRKQYLMNRNNIVIKGTTLTI